MNRRAALSISPYDKSLADQTQALTLKLTASHFCDGVNDDVIMSLAERATRMFEEACELAQAAGMPFALGAVVLRSVFDKPAGEIAKEIGDLQVTLYTVAETCGVSAARAAMWEIGDIQRSSPAFYADRWEKKRRRGLTMAKARFVDGSLSPFPSSSEAETPARTECLQGSR